MRILLPLLALACAPTPADGPAQTPEPAQAQPLPPPGDLALTAAGGVVGGPLTLSVTGAGWHDEISIVRSLRGLGDGPCYGFLGGACLGVLPPATLQARVWSDEAGDAELRLFLPADGDLVGVEACFQPVAIRGPGGIYTEVGAPDCVVLDRDSDGDGVGDLVDPCPDDPEDACVSGFSTDWVFQEGTIGQYTRCGAVADAGATCIDPEIRYGSVEGGVPAEHVGNDFTAWCTQLGFVGWAGAVSYGFRDCAAPRGRLFGCTSYDEATWHWCDWSDGDWYDESLDNHDCDGDEITEITCTR